MIVARHRIWPGFRLGTSLLLLASCACAAPKVFAYSVLSHEALIDAAWSPVIVPLLRDRYPGITASQLREAHAYAYGASVIQDLGYYPLGDRFFSDLTHYVRTGDFVEALIKDSRNANEYAFALGALSHYVADNTGHPLAVNRSVADMYPRLRRKYGSVVTYEDDPSAHMMVEFSFDVVQIAGAGYLPETYHNFIGFKVPEPLIERAFRDTYGLKFGGFPLLRDLRLKLYESCASEIIPALSQATWRRERKKILRVSPRAAQRRFGHRLSQENYRRPGRRRRFRPWTWKWKTTAQQASLGVFASVLVWTVQTLPKFGRLRTLNFVPPTPEVQDLFIGSFDVTVSRYETDLRKTRKGTLLLPDRNLDTGAPVSPGRYKLEDQTYAKLLGKLAKRHFRDVPSALRQNILAFYSDLDAPITTKANRKRWRKVLQELSAFKAASPAVETEKAENGR